jgi:hypothetical protein
VTEWKPPRNEYDKEKERLKSLPKIKDKKPRKKREKKAKKETRQIG